MDYRRSGVDVSLRDNSTRMKSEVVLKTFLDKVTTEAIVCAHGSFKIELIANLSLACTIMNFTCSH